MTGRRALSIQAWKEARALLPAWLACLAVIVGALLVRSPLLNHADAWAYFLGCIGLGALSVGHEYSYRTLGALLSQPVDRRRLIVVKFGVLAVALLVLAAVEGTGSGFFRWLLSQPRIVWHWQSLASFLVPLLAGLFVTPWLTMLARSPLAGVIFTVTLPVTAHLLDLLFGWSTFGVVSFAGPWDGPGGFGRVGVFWIGNALASWLIFMRLQALDGRGQDIGLPSWFGRRATSSNVAPALARRSPIWLLIKKELRLQQLALMLAGLYVIACLAVRLLSSLGYLDPAKLDGELYAFTWFHLCALPLLIGSLASAEERQLGTVDWQMLLPMASWKQWTVKVGVVMGLVISLTVGLPAVLQNLRSLGDSDIHLLAMRVWSEPVELVLMVMVLATVSLYVSSMCTGGLRALLISVPVILFAMSYIANLVSAHWLHQIISGVSARIDPIIVRLGWAASYERLSFDHYAFLVDSVVLLAVASFGVLLLRFGMMNHRSAERGAKRVWRQGLRVVAYLTIVTVAGAILVGVPFSLMQASISRYRYFDRVFRLQMHERAPTGALKK